MSESGDSKHDDPTIKQFKLGRLLGERTFSCEGVGNVILYEASKYQTAVENYASSLDAHYKMYL